MNPERWLDEHGDALFRFAVLRTGDEELAADLVQETLLAALEAKERFTGASSERTWLIGILKHKIADHFRKHARTQTAEPEWFDRAGTWRRPPEDGPWRKAVCSELQKALMQCLQELPPRQREAFWLREVAQESTQSACRMLGVDAGALHALVYRARMRLRACLERLGHGGKPCAG